MRRAHVSHVRFTSAVSGTKRTFQAASCLASIARTLVKASCCTFRSNAAAPVLFATVAEAANFYCSLMPDCRTTASHLSRSWARKLRKSSAEAGRNSAESRFAGATTPMKVSTT
jgi:hypothetical protein